MMHAISMKIVEEISMTVYTEYGCLETGLDLLIAVLSDPLLLGGGAFDVDFVQS